MYSRTSDQLGRRVELSTPPRRIVSTVPSQSELLHALGLDIEVAAITKFCVRPEHWHREKTKVGGTKKLHLERIAEIRPDLVLANKEENTEEDIRWLSERFPVWVSDISSMEQALDMIGRVGRLCNRSEAAAALCIAIDAAFQSLQTPAIPLRVLYMVWKDPYMAAGHNTFINDMLQQAGFVNALPEKYRRYPELHIEEIKALKPDVLLLSSEPFPFKGKHSEAVRQVFDHTRVQEVDGEAFSWYGSRMLHAPAYFKKLRAELSQVQ